MPGTRIRRRLPRPRGRGCVTMEDVDAAAGQKAPRGKKRKRSQVDEEIQVEGDEQGGVVSGQKRKV